MEHFIKQSYGKIWHFCHNNQGICFCAMTDENLAEYEILLPDGQEDFDVLIDDSDCIHLICQNANGNIIYLSYEQQTWHKAVILQSKTPSSYPKMFNIERVGNWINIIYVIDYKGKKMLTHQILGNDELSPVVLDYIEGKFSVAKDSTDNLYILYFSQSENKLGYRKFVWSKKEWETFEPVNTPDNFNDCYLFIDTDDNMHIVGTIDDNIAYFCNDTNIIGKGKNPIIIEKEHLYIIWEKKQEGNIITTYSTDGGKSFQSNTEFVAREFSTNKIFALNTTSFENGFRAKHCYGYISNSMAKIYLLKDFFIVSKTPPKPINKSAAEDAEPFIRKLTPKTFKKPQNDADNIELTKIKIQIGQMLSGIEKIQAMIENIDVKEISTRIEEVEKALTNFETIDSKEIYHHLNNIERIVNTQNKPKTWKFF